MQPQKIHWPSVLLTTLFGFGVLLMWGLSAGMGLTVLPKIFGENSDAVASLILAASSGFQGLLLLAAASFTMLKVIGRDTAEQNLRLPFSNWHIPVALAVVLISVGIGSLVKDDYYLSLILLPILTLTGILAPIWLVMSIGERQADLGPRWRAWGIFGLGMTLGPLIMMILELSVALFFVMGVIIYFIMVPELANKLVQLSAQIQTTTDPEQALNLLAPYMLNPAAIALMLSYTSLAIPMIEELFKPIGVWLFARQLKTPAAGFAMGILSGAAYGLFENFGMVAQAGNDWAFIVAARAGAGLLHITTTGLMGWAIVSLLNEKKYGRFFLIYLISITLHGVWNSAGISLALYTIAETLGKGRAYQWIGVTSILAFGILGVALLTILILSNQKTKVVLAPPSETVQQ